MAIDSFFHVALKVTDPDEAAAFYRQHLDAEILEHRRLESDETGEVANAIVLSVGDKRVYLFDQAPYEAAGLVDSLPNGFLHFGYIVDDIEAAFEDLVSEGATVVMAPDTFGDKKIGFFRAPGGVRIEFIEYLD